ncbi:hypothetical protein Q9L58_006962 [Maublancomyces gigas]|uniref:Uncharacterized protein n=1 Tax=Discina gigas TaxID=1032678 RepID=A0ABR3GE05_9PEZI
MNPLSRAWTSLTGAFTNPGSDSFSINPPSDFDMPPLITAVMARDIESVRQLLALGADTSAVDDLQYTSLIYAAMGGQEEIVLLLLASGADINAKSGNGSGMSALAQAVASGEEVVSKLLIARGAKTSHSELSDLGMVKYEFWRIGYQPTPPAGFDMPPLIPAVLGRHTEKVRLLLAVGADTSAMDHLKHNPLHYAAMMGNAEIVLLLLKHGAQIDAKSNSYSLPSTALRLALLLEDETVSKLLISWRAEVGRGELCFWTRAKYDKWRDEHLRLITAVKDQQIDVVGLLLARGADTSVMDHTRYNALHYAAKMGNKQIVLLLLAGGAQIDAMTDSGRIRITALALAVANGKEVVGKLLIAKGAQVSRRELSECGMAIYKRWLDEHLHSIQMTNDVD